MIKKNSSLVESQVPSFVKDLYTEDGKVLFLEFLKAYYEWAEQDGNTEYFVKKSDKIFDVDEVFSDANMVGFRDYFFKQFLHGIPKNVLVDKALLLKHGREFFINKGNENSFKFLFRILYNEDASLYIPWNNVLIISDNVKGKLSDSYFIQDSFYWQQFSYEITSFKSVKTYEQIVTRILHPAGMKLFGKFLNVVEVMLKIKSEILHTKKYVIEYVSYDNYALGHTYGSSIRESFDYFPNFYVVYACDSFIFSNGSNYVFLKGLGDIDNNSLIGRNLHITDGTSSGDLRTITSIEDFQFNLKKVTVSSNFTVMPDKTSKYVLFKNIINRIGVAQAGSPTTITLWGGEYTNNGYYDGWNIRIIYGPGAGETKRILSYDGATKVATISSGATNWTVTPDNTSVYVFEKYGGTSGYYTYSNVQIKHYDRYLVGDIYSYGNLGNNENNKLKKRNSFVDSEVSFDLIA